MKDSQNLSIASRSLTYSGVNATGVTVDVDNAGSVDHTGDVHIAVKTANGTVVESESFTASSTSSVPFTFTQERSVDSFADVEVVVEETADRAPFFFESRARRAARLDVPRPRSSNSLDTGSAAR